MKHLSDFERALVEPIDQPAMLARVERWSAINSGTRNLAGLARQAGELADAFAALPGEVSATRAGAGYRGRPGGPGNRTAARQASCARSPT